MNEYLISVLFVPISQDTSLDNLVCGRLHPMEILSRIILEYCWGQATILYPYLKYLHPLQTNWFIKVKATINTTASYRTMGIYNGVEGINIVHREDVLN